MSNMYIVLSVCLCLQMMGADQHAALSSRPVMCRKQTVSHYFISPKILYSYYSHITNIVHISVFLFIILGGTVQSKSFSYSSSTSSSNTSKKVGRYVTKHQHSNYTKFKIRGLSQINLLYVSLPQCIWSRGWHIISQRQWRVSRSGAKAGREAQGADEGSDSAEDLGHAGPQSHDREAGEGRRRVRINREILLPNTTKERKGAGRSI